jgi:hypothetical protein
VTARGKVTIAAREATRGTRRATRDARKRRRTTRLRRARASLDAAGVTTLRLRLRPGARRQARRYGAVARVAVVATDAAGNRSKRKKRRVTLTPRRGG